jgi:hypothetical protein
VTDPIALKRFPPGVKLDPDAIDEVPGDWETVQYLATIEPHPDDATRPILRWVLASSVSSGSPVTVEDGMGGFLIVFDEDGNVVYA